MPAELTSAIWIIFFALSGLLIGSFLNVCIYRLPAGLTIVRGRSFCPKCRHDLAALDLIPVLSYLLLGGRCRYCAAPIAARYMWVELLTGSYYALSAAFTRPGVFEPPIWLNAVSLPAAGFYFALFLQVTSVLTFSAFLVWAMIIYDQKKVNAGVIVFSLISASARVVLQPERLFSHLVAGLVALMLLAAATLRQNAEASPAAGFWTRLVLPIMLVGSVLWLLL
ncbi:MAG: prepilin peptidase [Saccharofermentanales bacterium]|nr:prepilin peptidase [Clostridiaceae bacterium]